MENKLAILDTGAIIAFLSKRDRFHLWTVATFKKLPATLVTCEAVLSECLFLLQRNDQSIDSLVRLVDEGRIKVLSLSTVIDEIFALMKKYSNVPLAFADACLVKIAEDHPKGVVVTTDSDFKIYKTKKNQKINCIVA